MRTGRRIDMAMVIVAFRVCANTPNKLNLVMWCTSEWLTFRAGEYAEIILSTNYRMVGLAGLMNTQN